MRSLVLHLVQALLAIATPSTSADAEPSGLSCPASAGHAGQSPFVFRLGLVHPRCLPGDDVELSDAGIEPLSSEPFEGFEEWKARQQADTATAGAAQTAVDNRTTHPPPASDNATEGGDSPKPQNDTPPAQQPAQPPIEKKGHRYNYASPDCSARVLSSSPSTQHASSLLHKSRDRYMLTPCRADQHYVVVELCDEIRIQGIEIAVWEFFSGVVRNIRLSVGGEENEEWKVVGDWIGKNVRGVQTFTLPEPTSFHRFIRLDFPSYYGTEYYCPVSQLKVYGLNQMEAFKEEQARSAEAKLQEDVAQKERERVRVEEALSKVEEERRAREAQDREEESKREQELCELEKLVQAQARRGRELDFEEIVQCVPASAETTTPVTPSPAASSEAGNSSGTGVVENNTSATSAAPLPSSNTKRDSSESIYAHIVRRLAALEGNGTLVARYIDEQARVLRGAVSRIEAVQSTLLSSKTEAERAHTSALAAQDARLHRLLTQVEYLKMAYESDRRASQAQLRALANELGFERRKSIAQLVILLSIVGLALFSKSEAIEQLLRPIATQRHGKKLSSGPLAGLVIDVATPRPSVSAQPFAPSDRTRMWGPESPTSPTWSRQRKKSSRPSTPTLQHLKRRALAQRSISMISGDEEQLPPRSKLRSAHLHPLKRADGEISPVLPTSPGPLRSPVASHAAHLRSPRGNRNTPTPVSKRKRFPATGDESQWDTSVNNTSASASEPASASEASNDLRESEDEYNGIGGLHLRDRWEEGASLST